jgi:hypothetical protein
VERVEDPGVLFIHPSNRKDGFLAITFLPITGAPSEVGSHSGFRLAGGMIPFMRRYSAICP